MFNVTGHQKDENEGFGATAEPLNCKGLLMSDVAKDTEKRELLPCQLSIGVSPTTSETEPLTTTHYFSLGF